MLGHGRASLDAAMQAWRFNIHAGSNLDAVRLTPPLPAKG